MLLAGLLVLASCATVITGTPYTETIDPAHPGVVMLHKYADKLPEYKEAVTPNGEKIKLGHNGVANVVSADGIVNCSYSSAKKVGLSNGKSTTLKQNTIVETCLLLDSDNVELRVNGTEIYLRPLNKFDRTNYLLVVTIDGVHEVYKLVN